jgi:NAD(P)-dependent dehydrogenase (short-subunit alcohol dehydrogenase family)
MGRLDGKVAVVTGGASGMGLATVERFVAEGAAVVIVDLAVTQHEQLVDRLGDEQAHLHYRDREAGGEHDGNAIAERLGARARFVPADVSEPGELEAAVGVAIDEFGGLDIMFNNAGVGGAEGSVVACSEALYDRVLAVDLKAVWLGIKFAAPHIAARGGGSIISTSSGAALMGIPGLAAYSAAKGGVVALTRAAAMELAADRVRVNCICPGGIVTPIIYRSPILEASMDPDTLRALLGTAHPIPRAGEPDDIANAALWLASDEASFVTGQAIAVDGGLSAEADSRMRGRTITAAGGGS